jgi:hypothetical protein
MSRPPGGLPIIFSASFLTNRGQTRVLGEDYRTAGTPYRFRVVRRARGVTLTACSP